MEDKLLTARKLLQLGISDRAVADLLNTFMIELNLITKNDRRYIIDRNNIRKWKAKVYAEKIPYGLNSIYFDGKINSTKQHDGTLKNEDHIIIISEPKTEYISHVIPSGKSTSENNANAIINKINESDTFERVKVIK